MKNTTATLRILSFYNSHTHNKNISKSIASTLQFHTGLDFNISHRNIFGIKLTVSSIGDVEHKNTYTIYT